MTEQASNNPTPRLRWAGKAIPVESIEVELALLWKISADNLRTGQNTNVRTSVLNLVICAPDVESAHRASVLLRDLSSTHLARVTILILDSQSEVPASISSWATLRCFSVISDLMRHCFEQTTLLASGAASRAIANIVQPLLKPDLPVYLWWLGDPPDDDSTFSSLVALSKRIIFDSTSFFQPAQDIHTLALLSQTLSDCALSDLNWGRITPWRQLIVQFFDVVEYRPYLSGVNAIEIEHAVAPLASPTASEIGHISPNPTRALLLAGWLKDRLGWSLAAGTTQSSHDAASGSYQWKMERYTNQRATRMLGSPRAKSAQQNMTDMASIAIRPQVHADMQPGSICLVRLTSSLEGKQATFTISREGDPDHVLTAVELARETRPNRTVSLSSAQRESDLLHDELEIMGHDLLFEQTLQEVANLLG